jgi:hypothetical protein
MKQDKMFSPLVFVAILGLGAASVYVRHGTVLAPATVLILIGAFLLASLVSSAIQIGDQWDKVAILRLRKFHSLKGPGYSSDHGNWPGSRQRAQSYRAEPNS